MPKKRRIIFKEPEKEDIISKSDCCYIGMVDEKNLPYVLPFNFGYKDKCIYLHSGQAGRKIDILKKNNRVCIVFSTGHKITAQNKEIACSYIMSYKSVICYGKVEFIEEYEKKVEALNIIMQQYTKRDFTYSAPSVNNVLVYKVVVEEMTGKEFGNLS
jgi:nitroimidazol reductase NimA-like FMN-containing flavoprotein (pyridoxamine 5'-phosphate oxidase superfamily)